MALVLLFPGRLCKRTCTLGLYVKNECKHGYSCLNFKIGNILSAFKNKIGLDVIKTLLKHTQIISQMLISFYLDRDTGNVHLRVSLCFSQSWQESKLSKALWCLAPFCPGLIMVFMSHSRETWKMPGSVKDWEHGGRELYCSRRTGSIASRDGR